MEEHAVFSQLSALL